MDAEVTAPISESLFLARYQAGERTFSGLEIVSDGSRALENISLDDIELVGCFLTVSLRGASLRNTVIHTYWASATVWDAINYPRHHAMIEQNVAGVTRRVQRISDGNV